MITPHADDETYGCAGTMARIKAAGGSVYVVLATAGDVRHYGPRERAADVETGVFRSWSPGGRG